MEAEGYGHVIGQILSYLVMMQQQLRGDVFRPVKGNGNIHGPYVWNYEDAVKALYK